MTPAPRRCSHRPVGSWPKRPVREPEVLATGTQGRVLPSESPSPGDLTKGRESGGCYWTGRTTAAGKSGEHGLRTGTRPSDRGRCRLRAGPSERAGMQPNPRVGTGSRAGLGAHRRLDRGSVIPVRAGRDRMVAGDGAGRSTPRLLMVRVDARRGTVIEAGEGRVAARAPRGRIRPPRRLPLLRRGDPPGPARGSAVARAGHSPTMRLPAVSRSARRRRGRPLSRPAREPSRASSCAGRRRRPGRDRRRSAPGSPSATPAPASRPWAAARPRPTARRTNPLSTASVSPAPIMHTTCTSARTTPRPRTGGTRSSRSGHTAP